MNSHSIKLVDPNSTSTSQNAISKKNAFDLALSLTYLLNSFKLTSFDDLGFWSILTLIPVRT